MGGGGGGSRPQEERDQVSHRQRSIHKQDRNNISELYFISAQRSTFGGKEKSKAITSE